MNWIEVAIKTTSEGTDAVAEVFYQAGINGVVLRIHTILSSLKERNRTGIMWMKL